MEIARQSTRGGLLLLAGNLIWTVVTAVGVIIVARLLGKADYGLFSLVVVGANLLQLFVGLGVNIAVTRFVAYHIARGEKELALRFAKNAILFTLLTGLVLSAICYLAAGPISSSLLHRPLLEPYVRLISMIEAGQALLLATISAAIGLGAMGLASGFNVSQGILRSTVSPFLLLAGFGIGGAVLGVGSSYVVSAILSAAVLYTLDLRPDSRSLSAFWRDVREMVRYSFPAFVASVLTGLSVYYVPLVLAAIVDDATLGNFQAASAVTVAVTILSTSAGAALFAAFSGLHGLSGDLSGAFKRATRYVAHVTMPVIFFLALAARQLIGVILPSFVGGTDFLVLLALASTPVLLGLSVIPSYFNGIGKTRSTLYSVGAAAVVLFLLAPLIAFTTPLGASGLILSVFVSNLVLVGVGLLLFYRQSHTSLEVRPAVATLLSSIGAYSVGLLVPIFPSDLATLMVKLLVFVAIYLTLGPLLRAFREDDLDLIETILADLGLVGRVASPFIRYERFIVSMTKRRTVV